MVTLNLLSLLRENVKQIFVFLATLGGVCLFFVSVSVSLMEGDSITLYNDEINPQDRMTWYFGEDRLALINDVQKICEDDKCKERFKDRLNVDQTGSLTITDIRNTDSGLYTLKIHSRKTEKIFSVTVHDVSAAELDEMKRKTLKEGESVTLDPGVMKNPNDEMTWYFNDILITEITGNQSWICTDDQCKGRFRDRLELDQTGSLTITDTRNTDSGVYQLKISSSRFTIIRNHTITVTFATERGRFGVIAALLLLIFAVVFSQYQAIKKCVSR